MTGVSVLDNPLINLFSLFLFHFLSRWHFFLITGFAKLFPSYSWCFVYKQLECPFKISQAWCKHKMSHSVLTHEGKLWSWPTLMVVGMTWGVQMEKVRLASLVTHVRLDYARCWVPLTSLNSVAVQDSLHLQRGSSRMLDEVFSHLVFQMRQWALSQRGWSCG